jgi:hypothetical protein
MTCYDFRERLRYVNAVFSRLFGIPGSIIGP